MTEPRYCWFPPAARSLGPDCVAWWKAAGGSLFDWQEFAIEGILGLDKHDHWASTNDGLDVTRQNGKGVILQAIEGFVAFQLGIRHGYRVVMHTAHEFATSLEHQLRLEEIIQNAPHLHSRVKEIGGYRHTNGQESIRLKDGTRIMFKARTRGGGRGFSGDLLVWDEAMEVPETVVGAQKPMLRASRGCYGQKTIYAGSAVDEEVHQHGVAFARIRERGIARSPRVSWLEYGAPLDHPDHMTDDLLRDRDLWRQANPSMEEGLITEETMEDEIDTMPARVAAVELLGVGAWPRTDGRADSVISIEAWDDRERAASQLQPPYALFFDVSPDRRTAIALAGRNEIGKFHVELQAFRDGTRWAPRWIAERWHRNASDIYAVACDGLGPAAAIVVELEELGVPVERLTSSDMAEACGRLVDLVAEAEIEHLGDAAIREALLGAATRTLNDRWAWARKSSRVNIAPLVAATGAIGVAAGISTGKLVIY